MIQIHHGPRWATYIHPACLLCSFCVRVRVPLLHLDGGAQLLQRRHDLLSLVLRYRVLHQLGRALHELLGVHQTQPQQVLDLLDDLGLRGRVELDQLHAEQGLLLGGWGLLLGLCGGGCWCGCCGRGGEASDGQVWDVESRLC